MSVLQWPLPAPIGPLLDLAPLHDVDGSVWLALTEDLAIVELRPDEDRATTLATVDVPAEPDAGPWAGHHPRLRLHASADGRFAAVVRDHGRHGTVVDLTRGGTATMTLDGGNDNRETVPFSAAFATAAGRPVLVHRTDSNRLDVSDPATGALLTARSVESPHDLDYYHGRLHVAPDGRTIADDGWVWHPVGVVTVWSLADWLAGNVWESEDGASRYDLCDRAYHWTTGMCFVGNTRLAVSGLGDDDADMPAGARIFDTTTGAELHSFPGPAGDFFSDGVHLYTAHDGATHVWDPFTGDLLATVPGFTPSCLHRGTGELAGLADGALHRWS